MKKSIVKIPIYLTKTDAETLLGLVDGCLGSADDEVFCKSAKRIIKAIELAVPGNSIKKFKIK